MLINLKVEKSFDIKYLIVDAYVRYWEDSDVNGEEDFDLNEDQDAKPRMPFAVCDNDEWRWKITIDVEEGKILGWPEGTTADVHYKVCDEGIYSIVCRDGTLVEKIESYVPRCLSPKGNGFGDYIIMDIDSDGRIDGFEFGQDDVDEMIENAF